MQASKAVLALATIATIAAVPRLPGRVTGTFALTLPSGPYFPRSRLLLETSGVGGPVAYTIAGAGEIDGGLFIAPKVSSKQSTAIVAAARGAVAYKNIEIVPPPAPGRALIAVAAYESGVALHDPKTFALLGYAPIGGPPGDVAFDTGGDVLAPDTDGDTLARLQRAPWDVRATGGVASGNEVQVDAANRAIFVSNRDVRGVGMLTRIVPSGAVSRVTTGDTAEGLAIDDSKGMVYVGNVNSANVAQIDARTMKVVRTIPSVQRTFGMALDVKTQRLYVVSNTSPSMRAGGGYVAAISLRGGGTRIVATSGNLRFPLGAALDAARHRLFVTDESADLVYVLNAGNLRPAHAPLRTCSTPWRPLIARGELFVPCARSNEVDVFNVQTLHRVRGAPFATGGFPLSVAVWP